MKCAHGMNGDSTKPKICDAVVVVVEKIERRTVWEWDSVGVQFNYNQPCGFPLIISLKGLNRVVARLSKK